MKRTFQVQDLKQYFNELWINVTIHKKSKLLVLKTSFINMNPSHVDVDMYINSHFISLSMEVISHEIL